jgi:hypothetical protein
MHDNRNAFYRREGPGCFLEVFRGQHVRGINQIAYASQAVV